MSVESCIPVLPSANLEKSLRLWVDGHGFSMSSEIRKDLPGYGSRRVSDVGDLISEGFGPKRRNSKLGKFRYTARSPSCATSGEREL